MNKVVVIDKFYFTPHIRKLISSPKIKGTGKILFVSEDHRLALVEQGKTEQQWDLAMGDRWVPECPRTEPVYFNDCVGELDPLGDQVGGCWRQKCDCSCHHEYQQTLYVTDETMGWDLSQFIGCELEVEKK